MTARLVRIPVGGHETLEGIHAHASATQSGTLPPLAILLHDIPFGTMRDHEDLFGRIENLLTETGLCTLRFDFRGCGGSEEPAGGLLTLGTASADLGAALAWGKKQGHTRFLIVAEGLAAALCAARLDESVFAGVFLWPIFDPRRLAVERFGADPDMSAPEPGTRAAALGKPVSAQLIYEMVRTDLGPFLKKVTIPLLLQQGDSDAQTLPDQLDIARKTLRAKRLDITTYAGADHGLTDPRHRKYMLYHIQQFVQKFWPDSGKGL